MKDKNSQNNQVELINTSNYEDIRVYLKRNSYLRNRKDSKCFWQSDLPVKWFIQISSEPFFDELLFNYFKSFVAPNEAFLKQFFNSNKKQTLQKIIKLSRVFNNASHWRSFSVFNNDKELKIFYKELIYVKAYQEYWQKEAEQHDDFIKSLTIEDILFQMTMYYEDFKQKKIQTIGNRNKRVSIEAILIQLIDTFIAIKTKSLKESKTKLESAYSSDYFKTITVENYQELKGEFRQTVDFYFAQHDNEYQLNKYLSGYAEFECIDGLEAQLNTNDKYTQYRRTLSRGTYDETYLTNRVISDSEKLNQLKSEKDIWNKQFQLSIYTSIEYFNFLKIPTKIDKSNNLIDLEKVLRLLWTFSSLLMPQGEFILNGKSRFERQLPKAFKELFYADYLVCFEKQELIDKCSKYFNWKKEETKAIIEFISTDLNDTELKTVDVKMNPFVKIGTQYFWLSSFMKDRRWEISLHRKLVSDCLLNPKTQSDNSEAYLSEVFKKAGFSSVASKHYVYENKRGEIDVLAYKDEVLFICELKSTFIVEDMLKTSKYEVEKFNKAAEQLDLAKTYVKENFDTIKAIKELEIDCDIENLKVKTIIISNSYQADHTLVNNKHLKVSLFELLIILKNDLYDMLISKSTEVILGESFDFPIDSILQMNNRNNPDYKETKNTFTKEKCNLWYDVNSCSAKDIISAIIENKVWRHQDENKHFRLENIELTTL